MQEEITQAKDLPDVLRTQIRESLFFFATAVVGFQQLTPHLHYEMSYVAQNASTYNRVCAVVPRDHYKTSIFTIAYSAWRGLVNPNETGLIIANNATNAERIVTKIRSIYENAPLLRQLYPELVPEKSKRWNKEEACLPRTLDWPEATWTAAGADTRVTSGHWDYIIFDDPVDETNYESAEQMKKLSDRFEQREGMLRPPIPKRDIIVVGNHWSNIDLISYIEEHHPEYYIYYRQAIEGGKPIFPEMYSLEWLYRKQQADPYTFATQWMNNPADEELAELKHGWLQYYKREPNGVRLGDGEYIPFGKMSIYAAVDLSHTTSLKAAQRLTSRNAIIVAGMDHKGRRYLLEEWAKRCDPLEVVNQIYTIWERWQPHGLYKIGVESFGYQAALVPLANELWKDSTLRPYIVELSRNTTRSKEARIRAGGSFFRLLKAFVHKSHTSFIEEYVAWPASKTKDALDAWAWAMEMCEPTAEPTTQSRTEEQITDHRYYQSLVAGTNI